MKYNVSTTSAQIFISEDIRSQILLTVILAPVAAAFFSFLSTLLVSWLSRRNERRLKTVDYIDNLLLGLNNLTKSFEKLKEDVERSGIFFLKNTNIVVNIINKLTLNSRNVILLQNLDLKRKILEIIDLSSSLINEIESLERYPLGEHSKLEQKVKERLDELKNLRIKLLDIGIYFDPTDQNKPKYFDPKLEKKAKKDGAHKKQLEIIDKIYLDILDIRKDEERLKQLNAENEKRRSHFIIRILDLQTKYRGLITDLNKTRSILAK